MQPATENVELIDAKQQSLGRIVVERIENGLVIGEFVPGSAYSGVERLFLDYEEAVNLQSLSVVDELDARIARLGLRVMLPEGRQIELQDAQIWSDGAISFRVPAHDESALEAHALGRPTQH